MKDFSPAEIARQVPELRKLLELREALVGLKSPLGNSVAFRKKLDELLKDPAQRDKLLKELGAGE
jgi:type VI secretion system protein ImpB